MRNALCCWDWSFLVKQCPQERHYKVFFALCDALVPTLSKSTIPEGAEWSFVRQTWRGKRGANGCFQQYRSLMKRVRDHGRKTLNGGPWRRPTEYVVLPVASSVVLDASLARCQLLRHASPIHRACVLSVVAVFVCFFCEKCGPAYADPAHWYRTFRVKCESVARVGSGRLLKGAR